MSDRPEIRVTPEHPCDVCGEPILPWHGVDVRFSEGRQQTWHSTCPAPPRAHGPSAEG